MIRQRDCFGDVTFVLEELLLNGVESLNNAAHDLLRRYMFIEKIAKGGPNLGAAHDLLLGVFSGRRRISGIECSAAIALSFEFTDDKSPSAVRSASPGWIPTFSDRPRWFDLSWLNRLICPLDLPLRTWDFEYLIVYQVCRLHREYVPSIVCDCVPCISNCSRASR